jgi:hypothetical protein
MEALANTQSDFDFPDEMVLPLIWNTFTYDSEIAACRHRWSVQTRSNTACADFGEVARAGVTLLLVAVQLAAMQSSTASSRWFRLRN